MNDIANRLSNFTTHHDWRSALVTCAIGFAVLCLGIFKLSANSMLMKVSFLNIGQGDSALIEVPSGAYVLIDAGPNDVVLDELAQSMPAFKRRISLALATHSDSDHIGGFTSVLSRYPFLIFGSTGLQKNSTIKQEVDRLVASSTVWKLSAGDRIVIDPYQQVYVDVLWPSAQDVLAEPPDDNDLSLVVQLVYGSTTALFTGDVGESVEQQLIDCFGSALQSDILKVAHHGSKNSTSVMFLDIVQPKIAVISVGEGNSYGHPTSDVIQRLAHSTAAENIYITKDEGRVTFVLSGAGFARDI